MPSPLPRLTALLLTLCFIAPATAEEQAKQWVVYPGGEGVGKGSHIVLVSGDEEYRSEEAMPMLGKILSKRHGFKCTVLFSINPDSGVIDPNTLENIPGLEALASADLMIIATRFRNLADEQMAYVDAYLKAGKPVVGLRTATHAFNIPKDRKYHKYSWRSKVKGWEGGFGVQVLGETWVDHHGKHGGESTRGIIAKGQEAHPINRGIAPASIWGDSDVYTINLPLPGDSTPVVMGAVLTGMKPDDPHSERKRKGVPVNNPMMPLAWTKTYEIEPGKKGRVFTSTLGAATDLVAEGSRRLILQGAFWAMGLEKDIPKEGLNVDFIDVFKPNDFGFTRGNAVKHKAGLKPCDFEIE